MKVCTGCGQSKSESDFWPERSRGRLKARCIECSRTAASAYRSVNAERIRQKARTKYSLDPAPDRERHLVRKYGVTLEDYDRMSTGQHHSCAICGRKPDRPLDVDHDHLTGVVRGLLCTNCNRMIGHAGDSSERLIAAANYLSSRSAEAV